MLKTALSFDDVLLKPRYSEINSRSTIDLSSPMGIFDFNFPIISSPMDTITETKMAVSMSEAGGLGIIHRYNSVEQQSIMALESLGKIKTGNQVAAAVGVSGDFMERTESLFDSGVRIICIDIAHGHHLLMKNAIQKIKNRFGAGVCLVAGNIATLEGFNDLSDWGADAVRVGVGGGSICSTRIQTGHGIPTLQSIIDCSSSDRSAAIIADGGIKNSGDATKALAAGADFVMLGSMLSGTDETPGEIISTPDLLSGKRKTYRGMASREAQVSWRNKVSSVEGVSTTVPVKGPVNIVLEDLERGIRSGMSYSGSKNISEFHALAQFTVQTSAGFKESSTHIMK